jgi:hypothetical protein
MLTIGYRSRAVAAFLLIGTAMFAVRGRRLDNNDPVTRWPRAAGRNRQAYSTTVADSQAVPWE